MGATTVQTTDLAKLFEEARNGDRDAAWQLGDLYREAARLQIELTEVEVEASAEFDGVGLAARDIAYRARIESPASPDRIEQLLRETDAVAEVHNTLRAGGAVRRLPWG